MDCPSCGAQGQTKARCEACGFTFPRTDGAGADGGDDALSLFLGLVCQSCDAYNDPGTAVCTSCGTPLSQGDDLPAEPLLAPASAAPSQVAPPPLAVSSAMTAPPSWMTPPTGNTLATQFAMKKVDLASIGGDAVIATLAPPVPTPLPMKSPLASTLPGPPRMPPVAPPSSSSSSSTSSSSTLQKQKCWRCATDLEDNDKFCRNCGARTDGGVGSAPAQSPSSSSAATQMISAMKLPVPGVPAGAAGATQIIPAFKAAGATLPASPPSSSSSSSGALSGGASATIFFGAATAERVAKLILVRGNSQFGNQWRLQSGETVIGRSAGMVLFPDDNALAPKHARLAFRGADLYLEPEATLNGCFLRLREPVKLKSGDEFVIGAQRLRLLPDGERPVGVSPTADNNGTRLLGSMVKPLAGALSPLAVMRVAADPRFHEVYFRAQRLMTIGRVHCDVNFANDGFVSERHAQLTNEGSHVLLEDLKSRNGTYARVNAPTKLQHGDLLLIGDQVLRIELPQR